VTAIDRYQGNWFDAVVDPQASNLPFGPLVTLGEFSNLAMNSVER